MSDEEITQAQNKIYSGKTNPKKLKLLLEELEQQKISTPSTRNITAIFEKHGWSPSESQARQYKIAVEEIRKKERAAEHPMFIVIHKNLGSYSNPQKSWK